MARNKVCGIYCIENMFDNKKYIGRSVDIDARWRSHKSQLRKNKHSNPHFQNSVNKYGLENFIMYILEECDESELDDKEVYYISFYDTRNYKKGYNVLIGGNTSKGRVVSQETRMKLSIAKKGIPKPLTPEQLISIQIARSGKKDINKNHSSQYIGVYWVAKDKRWCVAFQSKKYGYFLVEEDAAKKFDSICWKILKDKTKLNFPEIDYDIFIPPLPTKIKFSKRKNSSSKYIGVSWNKNTKKWQTFVRLNNVQIGLGSYSSEIEAAKIVDKVIFKNFGYEGVFNFPEDFIDNNLMKL